MTSILIVTLKQTLILALSLTLTLTLTLWPASTVAVCLSTNTLNGDTEGFWSETLFLPSTTSSFPQK